MRIARLDLEGFRNYRRASLEFDDGLTILEGPNAAGKTNVVEAIWLGTTGRSFRRVSWADLVRWGDERAAMRLHAEGGGRLLEVRIEARKTGERSFQVNGKTARTTAAVSGRIPTVLFTPDDLSLVKGSAEQRRDEIDQVGEQLSAAYRTLHREYHRAVMQRNRLFRDDVPDNEQLALWAERVADLGSRLRSHRGRLAARVGEKAAVLYSGLAGGERLSVSYVAGPSSERREIAAEPDTAAEREAILRELSERGAEEIKRRATLAGPHRDDIVFKLEGREARAFGSQGQQRSIVLAWKLAELSVVAEVSGQSPLLLLDDVMSELDEERRGALMGLVADEVQTVVTTTNLGYFDQSVLDRARVIAVSDLAGER